MYIEPEELTALYNIETKVIGILDYEVSLIGTNNDMNTYMISYNINAGGSLITHPVFAIGTTYDLNDIVESATSSGIYYKYINATSTNGHALTEIAYWVLLSSLAIDTTTLNWGQTYTVVSAVDISNFYTVTSGTLESFNTKADGTGFTYYPNQSAVLFENTILYCQWE
jgi:hypothetical protein